MQTFRFPSPDLERVSEGRVRGQSLYLQFMQVGFTNPTVRRQEGSETQFLITRFFWSRVFLSYPIFFLFASQQKERILVRGLGVHNPLLSNIMFAPSLNPSPQGGGKCKKTLTFFQKPAFQSSSKFLEYLIKATASILKSSIDANLCLPIKNDHLKGRKGK